LPAGEAEKYRHIPIRTIEIVIDMEDIFSPELTVNEFIKRYKKKPEPPRYRIVTVEVVTCQEDQQPILVTECGKCPRFIRRFRGSINCRKMLKTK